MGTSVLTQQGYSFWVPVQQYLPYDYLLSLCYIPNTAWEHSSLSSLFCQQLWAYSFHQLTCKIHRHSPPQPSVTCKGLSFEESPLPATVCDFIRLRHDLGLTLSDFVKWPCINTANGTTCPTVYNTASGIS